MRGEVLLHVFKSTTPECCCPEQSGKLRCAEWQTVSYDAVNGEHSSGSKEYFVTGFGHPGRYCDQLIAIDELPCEIQALDQVLTNGPDHALLSSFYPCWHSPDKARVILDRNWNAEFLWVPILSLLFMCLSAIKLFNQVTLQLRSIDVASKSETDSVLTEDLRVVQVLAYRIQKRHSQQIENIVLTPKGILPEEAWIYEDADFRPHPKQHRQYLQIEGGWEEAETEEVNVESQEEAQDRDLHSEDEYPKPKFRNLDDVLNLQEDVVEGE